MVSNFRCVNIGNIPTGEGVLRTENGIMWSGRECNNADHINKFFLVSLHPLSNIVITIYFNYKPRFNGVYLRDNLARIKDGEYVINLDDKRRKWRHWISLFIEENTAIFF